MKPGPKSVLTDKFKLKIRAWILQGKTDIELAELSGVSVKTIDAWKWKNYKGFHDSYQGYKRERMLAKSEGVHEEVLDMETLGDPKLIKIKSDKANFISETLGKEFYSKQAVIAGGSNIALINIEKQIINIANGEQKPILTTNAGSDEEAGSESLQGREGRTIDIDAQSVDSIRNDIHEIIAKSADNGSHSVRKESGGSVSGVDESGDIS